MSTYNIDFYEEISKIIPKLSSNIIKCTLYLFFCLYIEDVEVKVKRKKLYSINKIRKSEVFAWVRDCFIQRRHQKIIEDRHC